MSLVPPIPTNILVANAIRLPQASPPPSVLLLPVEIFLIVFQYLSYADVLRAAATCSWFYSVLHDNRLFFTRLTLRHHGLRLCRSLIPAIVDPMYFVLTQEQWEALLSLQWNLRWLQERQRAYITVRMPRRIFTTGCGFLVQVQDNAVLASQGVTFATVHFVYKRARHRKHATGSYRLWAPASDPIEIAIDPHSNVFAWLCGRRGSERLRVPYKIIFRSLSTNEDHPCAHRGRVEMAVNFDPTISRSQLTSRLRLSGPLVLVLMADTHDYDTAFVAIANWVIGQSSMIVFKLVGAAQDVTFLRHDLFVVTTMSGMVDLYRVSSMFPLRIFLWARLFLPERRFSMEIDLLTAVAPISLARSPVGVPGAVSFFHTARAVEHNLQPPTFEPSSDSGILMLTVFCSGIVGNSQQTYNIAISIPALLDRVAALVGSEPDEGGIISPDVRFLNCSPMRLVYWEMWRETPLRVRRSLDGHDFTDSICGWRTVERIPEMSARLPIYHHFGGNGFELRDVLVLTDYNPATAPALEGHWTDYRGTMSVQGTGRWTPAGPRAIGVRRWEYRSVMSEAIPDQLVFDEDVTSTLTAREVVGLPMARSNYVAFDEDRIWIMRWSYRSSDISWEVRLFGDN